ncbi:MAG: lipoate--protein ligase family protein [Leptospiraceae bacterium]|nr:lipoate--protein ligase family protein [Leptospiraceae bacterium]MCB1305231.1 lipoate--protein ligase family protein [Leptospiraceae bacterium]
MFLELPDLKPRNPYFSLALDEAVALHFGKGPRQGPPVRAIVRFWTNPYSIILGRTCNVEKNLVPEYIERFQVSQKKEIWSARPLLCRRASGGGTVLHGPGNLNYTITLSLEHFPDLFSLRKSYQVFLGCIIRGLKAQGVEARQLGLSDLVIDSEGVARKVSGNAQFRKAGMISHHGTLLTRSDLIPFISRYLAHPPEEPDYRKGRTHESFLGSLPDHFDLSSFYNYLVSEISELVNRKSDGLVPQGDRKAIYARARALVRERYGCPEWIMQGKMQGTAQGIRRTAMKSP